MKWKSQILFLKSKIRNNSCKSRVVSGFFRSQKISKLMPKSVFWAFDTFCRFLKFLKHFFLNTSSQTLLQHSRNIADFVGIFRRSWLQLISNSCQFKAFSSESFLRKFANYEMPDKWNLAGIQQVFPFHATFLRFDPPCRKDNGKNF